MDALEPEELVLPARWSQSARSMTSTFSALHGAYHVLHRRTQMELQELGLAPSEAVALVAASLEPSQTVARIRHQTGLRPSTLDSLLDRLGSRGLLRRTGMRATRGEVFVMLTPAGSEVAAGALTALLAIEAELRVFASPASLAAVHVVFEATRALGVPGTAADL